MSPRILLIEDDAELGAQIVARLTAAGYAPAWWRDGRRLVAADTEGVALFILDLMLPGAYGMDVLRDVRAYSDAPVLILSARNDSHDKVRALALGADDYMTKPFWPDELIERVKARLRRPALRRGDVIEIGALRIDLATHTVTTGGRPVDLTRAEVAVLTVLAERRGNAVPRARLTELALGADADGSRSLDVHVSRLRKKLGAGVRIETVWGIGYRLSDEAER